MLIFPIRKTDKKPLISIYNYTNINTLTKHRINRKRLVKKYSKNSD